jgi:hypothetical protein
VDHVPTDVRRAHLEWTCGLNFACGASSKSPQPISHIVRGCRRRRGSSRRRGRTGWSAVALRRRPV